MSERELRRAAVLERGLDARGSGRANGTELSPKQAIVGSATRSTARRDWCMAAPGGRRKIATHPAVNRYLEQEYCDDHNRRFAVDAASAVDYHLPMPGARKLREIFRLETERVLGNDWVVRHDNRFYQVEGQSRNYAPAKSKVMVCEWEDVTKEIHYRGRKLTWHEIQERPQKPEVVTAKRRRPVDAR